MEAGKVPTAVWVCITIAFLGTVGAFVYLATIEADAAEFRGFLNVALNLVGLLLTGAAAAYAGQAAKQTNGELDKRVERAAHRALESQRAEDIQPGGELRREH